MKVSRLVFELTAMPPPFAELTSNIFVLRLSNTAYPAELWIAAFEAG